MIESGSSPRPDADPPPPGNRTFDELAVGDATSVTRELTAQDVSLVAAMAGGLVVDDVGAEGGHRLATAGIGYAGWVAALVPTLLGTALPGPGTVYRGQTIRYFGEIHAGDVVTITLTVTEKRADDHVVLLDCRAVNQRSQTVMTGVAEVVAPTSHRDGRPGVAPDVVFHDHQHYEALIQASRGEAPVPTAVAYPCEESALLGAVEAADAGIIAAILVGPAGRIRDLANASGISLEGIEIVDVPDAQGPAAAAARAVELVRERRVRMVMKGSLHTDEMMRAVVSRDSGLRTTRRVSHVFMFDVPTYPKPLFVTDAAINISPTLEDKADICRNAIELGHAVGIAVPKVAILGAVEVVNPAMPSTIDAAALCKMADRGQIAGGLLDGPLAMDNAISPAAAHTKHIVSAVAGDADILLVPDLEAGNILYKNLTYLARADAAGIVLGARVPVILTSRSDSVRTRLASAALAAGYVRWQRTEAARTDQSAGPR